MCDFWLLGDLRLVAKNISEQARKKITSLFWLGREWLDFEYSKKLRGLLPLLAQICVECPWSKLWEWVHKLQGVPTEQGEAFFGEGSLDQKTPIPWRGERSDTCKEIEKPKGCYWNYLKLKQTDHSWVGRTFLSTDLTCDKYLFCSSRKLRDRTEHDHDFESSNWLCLLDWLKTSHLVNLNKQKMNKKNLLFHILYTCTAVVSPQHTWEQICLIEPVNLCGCCLRW